ncbi:LytTR family two component transcriptional regulator [Orbus hercynius]|uniref:LytTR family two component transcriptional regulator n=1 Tax=Orbus hercynius TaxID=593135 RepID=A0A495RCF5_9GAMM|nr:two-component system response regulator BtsR [Orbus hercynius]RKS85157.1 LytTR family two component transcriptional regulator [Orbus hercynius]
MLKAIIVDDEPLARENLRCQLALHEKITIMAECSNAFEAVKAIHQLQPDVVFLDIQMPKINGLEMLNMLDTQTMPHIVFLTAYEEFAIKAFEAQAFDYLLKPIEPSRLDKTIQRLFNSPKQQNLTQLSVDPMLKYIPCIGHSKIYLLNLDDVYYVSSRPSGVYVFNKENTEYFTELTLRTLEEKTPLIYCHRQYLINMKQLKEIRFDQSGHTEIILNNAVAVPVSRRYLKPLKEQLGL